MGGVKSLALRCESLRILELHGIPEVLYEDPFLNLEFLNSYFLKADKFTEIIQECPNLKEIIYICPEETIDTDLVLPQTLKALSIFAKEFTTENLNLSLIENVRLTRAWMIGSDSWLSSDEVLRTGQYVDKVVASRKFLLL